MTSKDLSDSTLEAPTGEGVIRSRANPGFRHLLAVAKGKGGEERQVMIDGRHLCETWLQHGNKPWQAWFDAGRLSTDPDLRRLAEQVEPGNRRLTLRTLLAAVSAPAEDQGVCFIVAPPEPVPPARIRSNCLWLDRVQDPGNLGTLLRTAAAAGLREVYLSTGCAAAWSAKVLRSSQGAHFSLAIHERQDLPALTASLEVPLIATSLQDAQSLYAEPLPKACAWLFGNEGQGVSAELLAQAHRRVSIPQDQAVESLNVAMAAAICLFEQRRQWLVSVKGR